MTTPRDDLQAGEGVNEGSAGSATESRGTGVTGALAAASTSGHPGDESDPAPPAGLPQVSTDAERAGPGQEVEAGEG